MSAKLSKTNFVISFGTRKKRGQEIILKNLLKINYRFDYIINCAGDGTVKNSYKTKFNNDLEITKNIIEFIIKHQPKSELIHISTASVFGNSIRNNSLKIYFMHLESYLVKRQL